MGGKDTPPINIRIIEGWITIVSMIEKSRCITPRMLLFSSAVRVIEYAPLLECRIISHYNTSLYLLEV
jgi:hypothetical protein